MSNDTDIFGELPKSATPSDSDIFKDASAPKAVAPVEQSKPQASADRRPLSPQQQAMVADMQARPWGSGLPKVMYDVGGRIADAGYPGVGAVVNAIPDALQMMMSGNVAAAASAPVMEKSAQLLMRSAMKPTLDQVKRGKAAPAVQTMLEEGFNPTAGGVEQMKVRIGELADKVRTEVGNSGATIPTGAVADYVPNAYARFSNGPKATQAIEDLGNVQRTFLEHPNINGAREIPIQVAQDMKTGYQRAIGDKGYDVLKTPETEGEKQIARGLRELIGQARPSVAEPLAKEAELINALKIAERRAAVDANKNPIGLGWIGQPWMVPFWMWDRSAWAKSMTARALHSNSVSAPALGGYGAGALYSQSQK
jgi:hypothetical protein